MASKGREERRRRIMERGSDRMALITGQVPTLNASSSLPASSTSNYGRHAHSESSPSIIFPQLDHAQINEGADDDSGPELLKNKINKEASKSKSFDIGNQARPYLRKCETNTEAVRAPPTLDYLANRHSSQVRPSVKKQSNQSYIFSSKRINYCIIASEKTRASFSFIIACLVLIVSSENIIASKPLYIVLLTDVTIVAARLYCEREESLEEVREESLDDGHNWLAAVKLLERGLVVYQAIRGIFVDCSIYLVVVICGHSLV